MAMYWYASTNLLKGQGACVVQRSTISTSIAPGYSSSNAAFRACK